MNEPVLDSFVTVLKYLLTSDGSVNPQPMSAPGPTTGLMGAGPAQPVQDDLAPILSQLQMQEDPTTPAPVMGSSPMGGPVMPRQPEQRLGSMAAGMRSAPNQMKDNLAGTLQKLGIQV